LSASCPPSESSPVVGRCLVHVKTQRDVANSTDLCGRPVLLRLLFIITETSCTPSLAQQPERGWTTLDCALLSLLNLRATICAPHRCVCVMSTVWHRAASCRDSLPISICVIMQYTLSSNGSWHLHCRNQSTCPQTTDSNLTDDLIVLSWADGQYTARDCTCPDTLAAIHLNQASVVSPRAAANAAMSCKTVKYHTLSPHAV
jgi:hypothetical protein